MKKFTLTTILIFAIGSFLLSQELKKFSPEKAVQLSEAVSIDFPKPSGSKVDSDTLINFGGANLTFYGFSATVWGYWTGHNMNNWQNFAEKFTVPTGGTLNGMLYRPAKLSGNNSITVKVWEEENGVPGTVIHSQVVPYSDITVNVWNDLDFTEPVDINAGTFFVGYEINYGATVDTFALYQTQMNNINTFYIDYPNEEEGVNEWLGMNELTGTSNIMSNLALAARVNLVYTQPAAQLDYAQWNAGSLMVNNSVTSETITLTNIGVGTLTVAQQPSISDQWSTSFNNTAVSLEQNESYTFTMTFNPTVAGVYNENFTINTNGGSVTLALSGTATAPVTGEMTGDFETNVNDFDLTFNGWVQHDLDRLVTYSISQVTFPNMNYVGSFIAFNPSATTPPVISTMVPHSGNRLGVCFAAEPGSPADSNNDWLITPKTETINSGAKFRLFIKAFSTAYQERYAIHVSTTNTDVSSFTKISTGNYLIAGSDWELKEFSLDAYEGQQVYIAIQCLSYDAFALLVDDIEFVNGTQVSVPSTEINQVNVYPNPSNGEVNISVSERSLIRVIDVAGRIIDTYNVNPNSTLNFNQATGIYFIQVESNGKIDNHKLIIQ